MDDLSEQMMHLTTDIVTVFTKSGKTTAQDIMRVSKDLLLVAISSIRSLAITILQGVRKLFHGIGSLGNQVIPIPILSQLWKGISGGHELTVFDLISLLIAIPTTAMAKLVTGKKPPSIPDLDDKLARRLLASDKTVPKKTAHEFDVLKSEIVLGLVVTKGYWNGIKIGYMAGRSLLAGALEHVGIPAEASWFTMIGIMFDVRPPQLSTMFL
jgi:hypothetical protein